MGRSLDAIAFHRQAIVILRSVQETWWLAIALDNLAEALRSAGEEREALQRWQESLAIFTEFSDPRARIRHAEVERKLSRL